MGQSDNNILITFEADPSGLNVGVDALENLGTVSKDNIASFNKMNDAINQNTKSLQNSGSQLQSYVQNLINIQKATVGAFGLKGLQDFEKQVNSTTDSTKLLQSALALAKQNLDKFQPNTPEWQQLNSAIQQGNAFLKSYGQTTQTTGVQSGNLLTQLRQLRFEMQAMDQAGLSDSQAFKDLSTQAAVLERGIQKTQERVHELASETANVDAFTQGVGALTAGFQVAAGASALFGDKNEDLQKTLIQLNAVMALSNGITQIQNDLKEQSILRIKLQSISEGILAASNKATTVTLKLLGITADETNFSFKALSATMTTIGIGAVVFLVTELISALSTAADATDAFNEAQKKASDSYATEEGNLNTLIAMIKSEVSTRNEKQDAIDKIKAAYPEYLGNLSQENIYSSTTNDLISKQIDLLQKRAFAQASQDLYIEKLKVQAAAQADYNRVVNEGGGAGEKFIATLKDFNDWFDLLTPQQILENEKLKDLSKATKEASDAFGVVNQARDSLSKGLRGDVDALQDYIHQFDLFKNEFPTFQPGLIVKPVFDPTAFDDDKKAALSAAQYKLDIAVKGTAEEMAAKRALTQAEYDFDLNDERLTDEAKKTSYGKYLSAIQDLNQQARVKYLNEAIAADKTIQINSITSNQQTSDAYLQAKRKELIDTAALEIAGAADNANKIKEIRAKLNSDLNAADIAFENSKLAVQKINLQDQLDLSKKGSQNELDAEVGLLETEKQIEINNANNNQATIQEIKDRYRKLELDKVKQFYQELGTEIISTEEAQTQDNIYNLQLQGAKDTDAALIKEKQNLIDEQAALEVLGIETSVENEEERRIKIKAVYDKALVDKKALEDAKNQAEIDASLKSQQGLLGVQKNYFTAALSFASAFGPARKKLDDEVYQNTIANIDAQQQANQDSYDKGLISLEQYNATTKELNNARSSATIENEVATINRQVALFNAGADAIEQITSTITNNQLQSLQSQQQANQDLYDNKLITQQEFNKRQAQIAKEEAAVKKEQAIFEVLIDFAKQLFKIESASLLDPALLGEIPILVAQELFSLGLIAAAKFRHGKVKIDGHGTETSDSIFAMLSKNESVINAAATKKYEPELRAMNELRFEDYMLKSLPHFDYPVMNDLPDSAIQTIYNSHTEIDYDQLAEKVGDRLSKEMEKVIKDMPQTEWHFDENGIRKWIRQGNQLDIYLNKKYKFNK